ncbi:MAG: hypothetical protein CMN28_07600 [Salinisphaeraceae bacterium]|jgi:uncharacterized protein (DUF427 family)|nr:hypothetical protein [Salinisphaeraceae bacterium]
MSNAAPGFAQHPRHVVSIGPPVHSLRLWRGGVLLARTEHARLVEETGYPPRHYLPADAFEHSRLTASDTTTYCPFKGRARYWHVDVGDERLEDAIWAYTEPYDECAALADCRAFYAEAFEVESP